MAKKKQEIRLEGLSDIDFSKEPDIESAQSIIEQPQPKPEPKPKNTKSSRTPAVPREVTESNVQVPEQRPARAARQPRSTFAPEQKKRATFNIDEDLHKALKDYSFFEEVDMVEYVFEHLVKQDLTEKGYYPPKKRKR